ncbi:protein fmp52-2, mitochondrial [Aspergillus spectabilis]
MRMRKPSRITSAIAPKSSPPFLTTQTFINTKTISQGLPDTQSPKLHKIQEPNTSNWPPLITPLCPTPTTLFNALGTSRSAAGGLANQWKIDHDLCIGTAVATKEAVGLGRYLHYSKMKNGVEDVIKVLGFENAVVLRPGLILGAAKAPFLEGVDKMVIGRAAVAAARIAGEGKAPQRYWVLGAADIVRLGRDEWVEK